MGYLVVELDLETFRADGALPVVMPARARRNRCSQPYLGGRPPMWWLQRAAERGRAALAVGLALWFKHGLQKGRTTPIRVDSSLRRAMALSHDQARRGVHALEAAGLVRVERGGRGRCAEVAIVAAVAEPSVAPA